MVALVPIALEVGLVQTDSQPETLRCMGPRQSARLTAVSCQLCVILLLSRCSRKPDLHASAFPLPPAPAHLSEG